MPIAYAANANLFVSAENSQFSNYMSGPQVIEVVVIDPDINDTDEAKGEPDVTVNGKQLRMVQAVDGNWYGYFADRTQAQIADQTVVGNTAGQGLDFGSFCDNDTNLTDGAGLAVTFGETVGIAVPDDGTSGGVQGTATIEGVANICPGVQTADTMNVLREEKTINTSITDVPGQINLEPTAWPFIQLYNLNPTGNVIVQYNKGGGAQTTTLTFDTVDQFAALDLDRTKYPTAAQVHVTVTDLWLNIDPTDEDSWTFGTNDTDANVGEGEENPGISTNYQVFDENGGDQGAGSATGIININTPGTLGALMCEDNCISMHKVS